MQRHLVGIALALLVAAPAAASTPAENAMFAWADKCPSTAMGAGIYQGEGVESVTVGAKTVVRVRTRSATPAAATETLWMLGEGCRAVGLVQEAPTAGGPRIAGFVVAKDGGAPKADEQATLLAWAGKTDAWRAVEKAPAGAVCPCAEIAAAP
jgi:hypothetical protein